MTLSCIVLVSLYNTFVALCVGEQHAILFLYLLLVSSINADARNVLPHPAGPCIN